MSLIRKIDPISLVQKKEENQTRAKTQSTPRKKKYQDLRGLGMLVGMVFFRFRSPKANRKFQGIFAPKLFSRKKAMMTGNLPAGASPPN
jgi:hypothetical protein